MPVYRHAKFFASRIDRLLNFDLPIFFVDDGNSKSDSLLLKGLVVEGRVFSIKHEKNLGKGAALYSGLLEARARGYSHALQIDADCQHLIEDIPKFLAAAKESPESLILGYPIFDAEAPKARVYGRKLTTWMIYLQTLSFSAKDGLFGFRVYPIESTLNVYPKSVLSPRMGFDASVLVYHLWAGTNVVNIGTKVDYPENGLSNFRYVQDNIELIKLYSILLFKGFLRYPSLFRRKLTSSSLFWYRKRERGSAFALSLVSILYKLGGRGLLELLLRPVILYFYLFDPKARKSSKQYLERVRKSSAHSVSSFSHFYSFGLKIIDSIVSWAEGYPLEKISWQGKEEIFSLLEQRHGALVLSAHIGCLEVTRSMHKKREGLKIVPLMYLKNARIFRDFLKKINPQAEQSIIPIENFHAGAAIEISNRIEKGEFVSILADRLAAGTNQRTHQVQFLQEPCLLPEGPFACAVALGCPVFAFFSYRDSKTGNYRAIWQRLNVERAKEKKKRRLASENLAKEYAICMEKICREAPDQWFNFYDFWDLA